MSDHAPDPALSRAAMRAALDAARLGAPSPNPHVGAAVVRGGAVVSVGHHQAAGHDHAEVAALRALGDDARGATVFVTLEPCNHHGRTPPCTEALVRAGVSRVVFAVADPNPHVTGHGRRALEAAGVEVVHGFDGELQREAERLLAPWAVFITRGRAHVTLKAAMSLDGRIATRAGESRWITGPAARADVHALRARCDAVVVGAGTARADDPMLTVRHVESARQPTRVVLATTLDLPPTLTMVRTAREVPTWVVHGEGLGDPEQRRRLEDAGALLIPVATVGSGDTRRLSLRAAFAALAARGVVSALVEGGGEVHGGIVDAGLVDRAVLYVAPMILGGGGAAAVGGVGVERLADALRLRDLRAERVGDDLRIEGECDVHRDHPVGR